MACQYCFSPCFKAGIQKNGNQKLRCKICKKYQLVSYANKGCLLTTKQMIIKLCKVNVGIRDIAKTLAISVNTVIHEIKKGNQLTRNKALVSNQIYEIDEMCSYVGNKNKRVWIAYAINQKTKEVAAIAIGSRTKTTLKKITDTLLLASPKKIYSDGLKIYEQLIPEGIHKVKQFGTNRIERMNLTIRTKLKRLNRKTICYSKSLPMLTACVKLLLWG